MAPASHKSTSSPSVRDATEAVPNSPSARMGSQASPSHSARETHSPASSGGSDSGRAQHLLPWQSAKAGRRLGSFADEERGDALRDDPSSGAAGDAEAYSSSHRASEEEPRRRSSRRGPTHSHAATAPQPGAAREEHLVSATGAAPVPTAPWRDLPAPPLLRAAAPHCPAATSCCSVREWRGACLDAAGRGLIRFVSPWSAAAAQGKQPIVLCIPALEYWCAFVEHHLRRHDGGVPARRRRRVVDDLRHLARARPDTPLRTLVEELLPRELSRTVWEPPELYVGDNFEGYVFFGVPLPSPAPRSSLTHLQHRMRRTTMRWWRIGKRLVAATPAAMAGFTCMFLADSISLLATEAICSPQISTFVAAALGGALTPVVADLLVSKGLTLFTSQFGSPPWVLIRKVLALYVVPNLLRLVAGMFPAHFEQAPKKAFIGGVLTMCRHELEDLASARSHEEGNIGVDAYQMLAALALDQRFDLHVDPLADAAVASQVSKEARAAVSRVLGATDASSLLVSLMGVGQTAMNIKDSSASILGFLRKTSYVASSAAQRAASIWGEATLVAMSPEVSSAAWNVQASVLRGDWSAVMPAVAEREIARPRRSPSALIRELIFALDAAYAIRAVEELRDVGCDGQGGILSSLAEEWSHALALISTMRPRMRAPPRGEKGRAATAAVFAQGRAAMAAGLAQALRGSGVSATRLASSRIPTLWSLDPDRGLTLASLRVLGDVHSK